MRSASVLFIFALLLIACHNKTTPDTTRQAAPVTLPKPAHVLVLIMENRGYDKIFESKDASNLNALAKSSQSVLFTQSYAVGHPSQPNYLALFSGDMQGSTDDGIPRNLPFKTPNLGSELINAGYTFAIYCEDMPEVGFNGEFARGRKYARKHNPVANWMGSGENQIPAATNQPFDDFPASNFDSLPTVCFVVPNQDDDMHDSTIARADKWYAEHLDSYHKWAAAHNSLLIVTFDEDDDSPANHITTIFSGAHVKAGQDNSHITHYSVLRTIEDFYHLPHAGNAAGAKTIDNCWE